MWLFDVFFPRFYKSNMSRYGYLKVLKSLLDFEITRVGYTRYLTGQEYIPSDNCLDTLSSGSENPVFILIWT